MISKKLTKKERKKVYKEALKHYKNSKIMNYGSNNLAIGMCIVIQMATTEIVNIYHPYKDIEKYFPEFYAFKPKTVWKKDTDYWFTRNINYGGYDKRLSILNALVDGKTPEQWKKEWKASGKR